jgi:DNA-binding transcriptional regulator YhcF (GntR family)
MRLTRLDERFNLSPQVVRILCFEIARGGYRNGDSLPAPADLACALRISPRPVEAAYDELAEAGLTVRGENREWMVTCPAESIAREILACDTRSELLLLHRELQIAGLSIDDIARIFTSAVQDSGTNVDPSDADSQS